MFPASLPYTMKGAIHLTPLKLNSLQSAHFSYTSFQGWMDDKQILDCKNARVEEWNTRRDSFLALKRRAYEFTIGVCSSIIQLPFLCTPKLLQGEVKHFSHNPLLRPWDPITVILRKHPEKENGSIQVIVYFRNQTFLNDHVRFSNNKSWQNRTEQPIKIGCRLVLIAAPLYWVFAFVSVGRKQHVSQQCQDIQDKAQQAAVSPFSP